MRVATDGSEALKLVEEHRFDLLLLDLDMPGPNGAPCAAAVAREQSDSGWLTATRDTQLPSAAAFGMLVVHDSRDNAQRLQAGRICQRLHLWATTQRLAMQPLNQMVERAEREQTANLAPEFTRGVAAMIPNPLQAIMPFRIGYPTQEALLSPRRPAEEVVEFA